MGYYPIFLDMADRRCVVVGGGAVAERKVEGLLRAGARVTIVSPSLTPKLASLASQESVRHIARVYQPGDLRGYAVVFVGTDDGKVNREVAREARELGVWVNAADDPAHCDFILPSVVERGNLVVAVATGGSGPALSRAIREELEAYFTEDYALLAAIVGEVRRELKARSSIPTPEAWHNALDGDLRRLITQRRREEARTYLLERLGA